MSIEKYTADCDSCSNYESLGDIPFMKKVETIKEAGWRIIKLQGIWRHYCSVCVEDHRKDPNQKDLFS